LLFLSRILRDSETVAARSFFAVHATLDVTMADSSSFNLDGLHVFGAAALVPNKLRREFERLGLQASLCC
jgi:hypothetical protein